jgi:hypothetical protein
MHSIRLDIEDSVFDKVIYFLKNLPVNEVKIIEDTETSKKTKKQKFNSIRLHTKDFKFDREEANAR